MYPAVDDEISHQKSNDPEVKSLVEELIALESLVNIGLVHFQDERQVLDLMRQISAISIRCIENHGLVPRVDGKK